MAEPKTPSRAGAERRSSGDYQSYLPSQEHLLHPTADNPQPTACPPPIAALAGTLGARHVLCFIGLPERGKPFLANRIAQYLSFFHGAQVKLFDLSEYRERTGCPAGSEENAQAVMIDLRAFMEGNSISAGRNMDSVCSTPPAERRSTFDGRRSFEERASASSDAPSLSDTPKVAGRDRGETESGEFALVDEDDARRKNVDSGRVALIFATGACTPHDARPALAWRQKRLASSLASPASTLSPHSADSFGSFKELWSGTSKERRRWAADALRTDRSLRNFKTELIFIEVAPILLVSAVLVACWLRAGCVRCPLVLLRVIVPSNSSCAPRDRRCSSTARQSSHRTSRPRPPRRAGPR